jgi:hypothetical protein
MESSMAIPQKTRDRNAYDSVILLLASTQKNVKQE